MKKRRIGTIAALAIAVMTLGSGMTQTFAANGDYVDKPFSFCVDGKPTNLDPHMKYNTSSVYIRIGDAPVDFVRVQAQGYIGNSWVNKTVGGTASVPRSSDVGQGYRIRAALLESNNYNSTFTRLVFPDTAYTGTVQGHWSPDCKGNYPAVN